MTEIRWLIILVVVTLASVKKKISEEEHEKVIQGGINVISSDTTPSDFIISGLDLVEQQCVVPR